MTILIFVNGEEPPGGWEWVRGYLSPDAVIIAADGGARHIEKLGLTPQIVIGDLDSLDPELEKRLAGEDVEFISLPADKDETDLELALIFASRNHERTINIFGATGGRLDQTVSNILLLSHPDLAGRDVYLVQPHQIAWMVENETTISGKQGDLVSLLPLWGDVRVRRTVGLKWPLQDEWLYPGPARGVSNVMISDRATVEIAEGRLLCVHADHGWNR